MLPNILFYFTDQQRFDTLGCNGQTLNVTPNIDRFASEGVNFTQAFTPQPVCGPARACIQTGLYPTETGCHVNARALPVDQETIAKRLHSAGYQTAYVGKWHLASDDPENQHFETSAVPLSRRGGYNDYWYAADVLEFTSHGYDGYVFDQNNNKVAFKGYRTDCITDYALDFLQNYNSPQPFFLFLSHIEPHHQNDHHNFEGPNGSQELFSKYDKPADLAYGAGDWETYMPDYLGCCNALDRNFGRIVETLKARGLYEQTLIIYASDHGCHFRTINECNPGGFDDYKRNSFENTIHIPLIIRGPGFEKGKKEDKLVSLIDLPATILTAAGLDLSNNIHGQPLQEIYRDDSWENAVYIQISESFLGRALRTDRYKYVIHAPEKHPVIDAASSFYEEKYLFDLIADPLEQRNLIDDPAYHSIKEELKVKLLHFASDSGEHIIEIK